MADGLVYQVKAVRIGRGWRGPKICDEDSVYDFWLKVILRQTWFDEDKEAGVVMLLDAKLNVLAWTLVSIGLKNCCMLDVTGVFRSAVACSASNVIILHNHPSGECTPSKNDLRVTRKLVGAGALLGVSVLDHLIVSRERFCSMRAGFPEIFRVKGSSTADVMAAD